MLEDRKINTETQSSKHLTSNRNGHSCSKKPGKHACCTNKGQYRNDENARGLSGVQKQAAWSTGKYHTTTLGKERTETEMPHTHKNPANFSQLLKCLPLNQMPILRNPSPRNKNPKRSLPKKSRKTEAKHFYIIELLTLNMVWKDTGCLDQVGDVPKKAVSRGVDWDTELRGTNMGISSIWVE